MIDISIHIPQMNDFDTNDPDIMMAIKNDLHPQIDPEVPVDTGQLIASPNWYDSSPSIIYSAFGNNGYDYALINWEGHSSMNHWGTGTYQFTETESVVAAKADQCFGGGGGGIIGGIVHNVAGRVARFFGR